MSFATTILIVTVAILLYYVTMISYDLYMANIAKSQTEGKEEELIDVKDQLQDFQSYDVNTSDEETDRKKSLESFICKGLSPEKMNQLMIDAAEGTPNVELNNMLFKCNQILSESIQ